MECSYEWEARRLKLSPEGRRYVVALSAEARHIPLGLVELH